MKGFRQGHEPRQAQPGPAPIPNVFRYHVGLAWAAAGASGFLGLGWTSYRVPLVTHEQVAAMREQLRRSIVVKPQNAGGPMIVGGGETSPDDVAILAVTFLSADYIPEDELDRRDPQKRLANTPPAPVIP